MSGQSLIDLFRDKGHDGVKQFEYLCQSPVKRCLRCGIIEGVHFAVQIWFDDLKIPVTEFMPHKGVECICRVIKTVFFNTGFDFFDDLLRSRPDPSVGQEGGPVQLSWKVFHHP